jgi:hypothetical protein
VNTRATVLSSPAETGAGLATAAVHAAPSFAADANAGRTMNVPVSGNKPSIVLVHGSWADGSSYQGVDRLLQQDGSRETIGSTR